MLLLGFARVGVFHHKSAYWVDSKIKGYLTKVIRAFVIGILAGLRPVDQLDRTNINYKNHKKNIFKSNRVLI